MHFTKVKICKHCVCNFLGPQVLAMERGPFHKGQYAVFVSVCSDQAIYERFPTKNTLFNISDWGHDWGYV